MAVPNQPGHNDGEAWAVEERHTVRPYALTGGRTTPRHSLRLLTQLVARPGATAAGMVPEADAVLALCRARFCSVAEISAHLRQPVLITTIILSDLIDAGALDVPLTAAPDDHTQLLEDVLEGLRRKWPDATGSAA